jgi:hypothetical protein
MPSVKSAVHSNSPSSKRRRNSCACESPDHEIPLSVILTNAGPAIAGRLRSVARRVRGVPRVRYQPLRVSISNGHEAQASGSFFASHSILS